MLNERQSRSRKCDKNEFDECHVAMSMCVYLEISLIACAVYRSHKNDFRTKSEEMLVHGKCTVVERV